jgi:hypothetical protein
MQRTGFEWFYRFLQEPRRMFRRYFIDDMAFFGMLGGELAARRMRHIRRTAGILLPLAAAAAVLYHQES